MSLRWRPVQERRTHVEPLGPAIGSCQLPVDEHSTAGILAARRLRVRWDQPINESFDGGAFLGSKIDPWSGPHRCRWSASIRLPRQAALDGQRPSGGCRKEEGGCGGQQFAAIYVEAGP